MLHVYVDQAGIYEFRLTVTDAAGQTAKDDAIIYVRSGQLVFLHTYIISKSDLFFLENMCKDWNKLCVVKDCTAIALPQVKNVDTHFPGYLLSKKRGRFSDTFCITVGIHAVTTLHPVFTRD